MQQQRRANAHGGAGHSRDQRLGEVAQGEQKLLDRRRVVGTQFAGVAQEIRQVIAGGEHIVRALDHHHAHRFVTRGGIQRVGQRLVHGRRDGVLLAGPVEGQRQHARFVVGQDVGGGGLAHGGQQFSSTADRALDAKSNALAHAAGARREMA